MKMSAFKLAFVVLLIATVILGISFCYTIQEYSRYCEWFRASEGNEGQLPNPYYSWNSGFYVTIATEFLILIWIPFAWYSVRERVYPYLKQRLSFKEVKRLFGSASRLIYDTFYGVVLQYFKSVNRKVKSKLALWYMKSETLQHVDLLLKVFRWIILPASLFYVFSNFYFFKQNALDSMFLGILIFFYSSFLPDLPPIFRRKIHHDVRDTNEDLPWYKKYALLLLAPLFIAALFCGMQHKWKTAENFHNYKSLLIYGAFVFTLSLFVFGNLPISVGDITEILSVPFYGSIGYLTHLKVDKIW